MKRLHFFALLLVNMALFCAPTVFAASVATLPDFRLLDQHGRSHTIRRYTDTKAVAIMAVAKNDPALVDRVSAFAAMAKAYGEQGIHFFLICPEAEAGALADRAGTLPVLLDEAQVVLPALGLGHAGECVLARTSDWKVLYHGDLGSSADGLSAALAAITSGGAEIPTVAPSGPELALVALPTKLSYAEDIAPILSQRCVTCHSDGNIGPFSMDSHRKVAGRADMIAETIRNGAMPPWNTDPRFGHFSNAMELTRDEKRTLLAWIDAGTPKDGDTDPLAEAKPAPAPTWKLGQPDLIVKLPEPQEIPADGVLDYRYYEMPLELPAGTWLRGTEVRITQSQVMHHVLVYMLQDGQEIDFTQEYIASYVPGHDPGFYPDGTGKPVPTKAKLLFQLHYTPNGKAVTDTPELGLYFCKEKPTHEIFLGSAVDRGIAIPAHATEAEASAVFRAPADILVYSLAPHMHYRGRRMSFEAIYPDGQHEMLLSVPSYDFYWQHSYHLAEPKRIPKGTVIQVAGAFDNSKRNPINPDPTKALRWGEQSTNEMFIGSILYRAAD